MENQVRVTEEMKDTFRERGYTNEDTLPKMGEQQDQTVGNYFTLWMGAIHNIPNYNAVIPFIVAGIATGNIMLGLVLAGIAVATLMVINGRAGAKYGIPFSMQLRSAYGVTGSKLPGFLRGVVAAIGWFGIQNFTGAMALYVLIVQLFPAFAELGGGVEILGIGIPQLLCFLVFTFINLLIGLGGGGEVLNKFTNILTPLIYLVFGGATIWAINVAGGIGNILSYTHPDAGSLNNLLGIIFIVNSFLGVWAGPAAGVGDFTQNAESQESQRKGQYASLVVGYIIFAITSTFILIGGNIAYGPQEDILDIINQWPSLLAIAMATVTLLMSTISTNATSNIIPAGYQLSALFPNKLNYRSGVMVATLISVLIMPWNLADDITGFLNAIGAILGPIAGVMIADYYVVNNQTIDLNQLYMEDKANPDNKYTGTNKAATIATIIGVVATLAGSLIPVLSWISNISYFVGFGLTFVVYLLLKRNDQGQTV